jgi:hypothetical protein
MLLRNTLTNEARRGVILMVVLALLTLFAIVGLSFVLYAQAEADASRIFREDKTLRVPAESADRMWSFALSKLIYDEFDDTTGSLAGSGVYSAMRGHSLGRSMYGFDNYIDGSGFFEPNLIPFNGTGRLQSPNLTTPFGIPEWQAVNYTFFQNDGQLHDPERMGWRGSNANPGLVTGGINVPYTYPDLNNMFLGAINAGGQVLMTSFHRPWLFGAIDPNSQPTGANPNANWTNAQGKYMTLRPRPADMGPNFPYPDDAGGDVKNLWWLPGGNDSIWIDLNYPVQIAPDGRKYKPLFAFFITDLDNRINLNVHGNIRGQNGAHVSNSGWVKSEVNLSLCLVPNAQTTTPNAAAPANEWQNLFVGVGGPNQPGFVTVRGRYGWDNVPNDPSTYTAANTSSPGTVPHQYGQVDFDGMQQNGMATGLILLPAQSGNPYNVFPTFQAGYDNGIQAERVNHPQIFDFFKPFSDPNLPPNAGNTPLAPDNRRKIDDRIFPASEMKDLLNGGLKADPSAPPQPNPAYPQMAQNAMKSYLGLLCPFNFNDPLDIAGSLRRRSLVTTLSMDIDQPGMMPWMWTSDNANVTTTVAQNTQVQPNLTTRPGDDVDQVSSRAPWGNPTNFPDPSANRNNPVPTNSEFTVPGGAAAPPTNWRAAVQSAAVLQYIKPFLGRLDLTRTLQPYPNQVINPATGQANNNLRFDDNQTVLPGDPQGRTIYQVYQAATSDRQNMAADIYRLLRKLCGVSAVSNTATPTEQDLMPRRWLAQLAVNIVDFIDSDDISTPFNFYPDNENPGNPPADAVSGNNAPPTETPPANPPVLVPATKTTPAVNETLKYWVFGVEMPRVILNEVFGEYNVNTAIAGTYPNTPVNTWVELFCPMTAPVAGSTWDPSDNQAVALALPATKTSMNTATIAPYRVMLGNNQTALGGPLMPRPSNLTSPPFSAWLNDNILGTPDQIRQGNGTDDTTPAFTGTYYTVTTNKAGTKSLTPGAGLVSMNPQTFMVVGPGNNATGAGFNDQRKLPAPPTPQNNSIPGLLPDGTVCIPNAAMTYNVNVTVNATGQQTWTLASTGQPCTDWQTGVGVTALLRRLVNPRMPLQPNPTLPDFNPYVTVDYIENVALHNYNNNTPPNYYYSTGKLQPFAADKNLVVPQGQTTTPKLGPDGQTSHTLGQVNVWGQPNPPFPALPAFDWLVHLDRALSSPIELLNVCFYHPHELTHRFVMVPPGAAMPVTGPLPSQWKYKHTGLGPWFDGTVARTGPWFDQTTRLYRFLEFVECYDRAYGMGQDNAYGIYPGNGTVYGVSSVGRRPGKVNINTVWDREIISALLDPQISNYFTDADVTIIYNRLLNGGGGPDGRTPNYINATQVLQQPLLALSQADRPFLGMAAGNMPYTDPNYGFGQNGMGIGDTLLRPWTLSLNNATADGTGQGHPDLPRLFENPRSLIVANPGPPPVYTPDPILGHPYLRFEPLNKIYNNLTTRSNVFAVWCTVGYFEVVDDTTRPVKLGAEIGKAAGTNVRHRFFSVIDRTELVIANRLLPSAPGAGGQLVSPTNSLLGPGTAWVELEMAPGGNQLAQVANNVISGQLNANIPGRPPMSWSIGAGSVLVADRGTANEEWVQVVRVSATQPPGMPAASATQPVWVQAVWIRPHSSGFGVTEPGNPGPQPPIDVRDYQHAPVVPVSVNVSAN